MVLGRSVRFCSLDFWDQAFLARIDFGFDPKTLNVAGVGILATRFGGWKRGPQDQDSPRTRVQMQVQVPR